jgi:hypothetical protein
MRSSLKPAGKVFLTILFLFGLLTFFGCSESSSDSDSTLPLTGPESVQVTPGNGLLTLDWTRVAPAQGVEAHYIVYIGTTDLPADAERSNAMPARVGTTQRMTVTITGLTNETEYFVWVETIFGSLGKAPLTPAVSGTPIPPAATPEDITVSPGEALLLVNWTATPRASSYAVAYSTADGANPPSAAERVIVSTNMALLTGLSNGTTYYVWVMSSNTAGNSSYSASYSGTPAIASAFPDVPAISTVRPRNEQLIVSWEAIASATTYQLHWTDGGSVTDSAEVTPTAADVSYTITGLTNDTEYTLWLVAVNSRGDSANSAVKTGTPIPIVPIDFNDTNAIIGTATADFINAEDLPPSPFLPDGASNRDRLTRVKETAMGNLFADGLAWYIRDRYPEENLDFVFLNGGYIDTGTIPQGPITLGRLGHVLKPGSGTNKITFVTLKGSDVKEHFNNYVAKVSHSVASRGGGTGAWGITSAEVRYTISYPEVDMSVPGPNWDAVAGKYKTPATPEIYYSGIIKPGTLKINGADFDDNTDYRIATTDFQANGFDGYLVFPSKGRSRRDTDVYAYHGVAEYIYEQIEITPFLDGRLAIEGGVPMGGQEPQVPYK